MTDQPLDRRGFLVGAARRAAYVAPAVLAISAARRAGAGGPSCGDAGSPCAVDGDCCTSPAFLCKKANGMPCAGAMGCTCQ